METILQDIRYAVRVLARSRAFTFAALLTLMLGIGATTSIFSVLYGVVFQPLPYPDPSRLVIVWETDPHNNSYTEGSSLPDFVDWKAQSHSFQRIAGGRAATSTLADSGREAERVNSAMVLPGWFETLGVLPSIGRTITERDDVKNAEPVVLISDRLWHERYGGAAVLDRMITLDGQPHRIIGVMPEGFGFPNDAAVWMPFVANASEHMFLRGVHALLVVGRLTPSAGIATAQSEMSGIMRRLEKLNPADDAGRGIHVETVQDALVGEVRPRLLLLTAAVSLVLLIGCINIAGLMLARANARSREIAIRTSLGASRARLTRQLLVESLVLSFAGTILGIGLAVVATRALLILLPTLPRARAIGMHAPVLLFAAATGIGSALLFGLVPALRASRGGMFDSLRGRALDKSRTRLRATLVVAEIALAVVLVVGAGLFLASLSRLLSVDPGIRTDHVLTAAIELPSSTYPVPGRAVYPHWPKATNFYAELLTRLRAIPGVISAAAAINHPLNAGWTSQVTAEGQAAQPEGERDESRIRIVSGGYFESLGIPLLRGRTFDARDRSGAPDTLLINEAFARRYFPRVDPVGKHVSMWGKSKEVVGVVRGERFRGLGAESDPAIYPPLEQMPMSSVTLILRVEGDPMRYASPVRSAVRAIDSGIAVSNVEPVGVQLTRSIATPRFQTTLVTLFGCIALVLAAVGLYGLIAYQVQQRTREIGIRVALGAQQSEIAILVVKQGLVLALIGIAIGIAAALGVTRFIAAALFNVSATDPGVFAVVAAMLTFVALIASYIPARRASRVDPCVALRYE
jgi:putative ABC transport system permease protein